MFIFKIYFILFFGNFKIKRELNIVYGSSTILQKLSRTIFVYSKYLPDVFKQDEHFLPAVWPELRNVTREHHGNLGEMHISARHVYSSVERESD